ncbi:MAG: hypothetical protein EOP56_17260 [Sphingobacteriales bacterium]|nr:MAG: hypothetical protein EOP56_17260 [Sphingobacteriales bacterium]
MKGLLLFTSIFIMSLPGFAQGVGFEAGGSLNNMRIGVEGTAANTSLKPAARIGIVREEFLSDHFSTQYGIFYNAKGSCLQYTKTKFDGHATTVQDINGYVRVDYFELPISVLYHSNTAKRNGFFIGGGAYAGAAFGGLLSIDNNFTHINGVTYSINNKFLLDANIGDREEDDFRMLDAGLQLQGGYELKNGLYARMHYSYGLVDVDPSSTMSMKNQSIGVTVGYMFRR